MCGSYGFMHSFLHFVTFTSLAREGASARPSLVRESVGFRLKGPAGPARIRPFGVQVHGSAAVSRNPGRGARSFRFPSGSRVRVGARPAKPGGLRTCRVETGRRGGLAERPFSRPDRSTPARSDRLTGSPAVPRGGGWRGGPSRDRFRGALSAPSRERAVAPEGRGSRGQGGAGLLVRDAAGAFEPGRPARRSR